jgi:hypothetical protein
MRGRRMSLTGINIATRRWRTVGTDPMDWPKRAGQPVTHHPVPGA